MEAGDASVPLYDRIKFMAIYSSNLDEFFRVRVAAIRSIVDIDKRKINKRLKNDPKIILEEILNEVNSQLNEFGRIKRNEIIPQLKGEGIYLYRNEEIKSEHKEASNRFFKSKILSYLQPELLLSLDSKVFLENKQLYFALELRNIATFKEQYAILNIPSAFLPRFIQLPAIESTYYFIAIDDIIRENLDFLFPQYKIEGCYSIKLNRDADLNIEDEYEGNLVKKIRKQITKRKLGVPSRFLFDQSMPDELLKYLKEVLDLKHEDLVPGGRYHNMHDLFGLDNPKSPDLETPKLNPLNSKSIDEYNSIFEAIDKDDVLLHFPYQSYDYVLRFFNEAALNPEVTCIKATFYRIAPESFICNALISAAKNGKEVTVFVEIKARFDEQNNLKWASRMEESGIKIIYSMPGLKVHAKVALVTKEVDGEDVKYGYFGTGNFNERTAEIYADQALLTTNTDLNEELDQLFSYLAKDNEEPQFNHLLISQFNIVDRFTEMIDNEIELAKSGKKAHIIIKINNLQDDYMIDKLYEASNAGVRVDLIVRAICCLVPGVKGQSENIQIHRIVDSFLEHSRVFYFNNDGDIRLYQGSSDWMKRNLYRRIEVVFPILRNHLKMEIIKMLELQLADGVKGKLIDSQLNNLEVDSPAKVRSQRDFYEWLKVKS